MLAVVVHQGGGVTGRIVVRMLAFVIPMVFTVRHSAAVRARAGRARA